MATSPKGRAPRRISRLPVVMAAERARRLAWLPVLDAVVSVPATRPQRMARALRGAALAGWLWVRAPNPAAFVRADS